MTLVTVRNKVVQCSLWKGITILTLGNLDRYSFALQLKGNKNLTWYVNFKIRRYTIKVTNEYDNMCSFYA